MKWTGGQERSTERVTFEWRPVDVWGECWGCRNSSHRGLGVGVYCAAMWEARVAGAGLGSEDVGGTVTEATGSQSHRVLQSLQRTSLCCEMGAMEGS